MLIVPGGWSMNRRPAPAMISANSGERPFHLLLVASVFRKRGCRQSERIEGAGSSFEMPLRQVQVTAGRPQIGVAEQELNRAQICAGLE